MGPAARPRRPGGAALAVGILALGALPKAEAATVLSGDAVTLNLGGDAKSFSFATFPYDSPLLPADPTGQGIFDLRLKAEASALGWLRIEAHHQLTAVTSSDPASLGLGASFSGAGGSAPQAVDLSWAADASPTGGFTLAGRVDRLAVGVSIPHVDLKLGRQPISFGQGYFFGPMDLVSPFSPTAVDREYKPGVDALRADAYLGTSTALTAVAAWLGPAPLTEGDASLADLGLVLTGTTTLGLWDVGLFLASIREDRVVGIHGVGAVGPVSLRAEGTLTLPPEGEGDAPGEDPFARGLVGADLYLAGPGVSFSAELYYQSLGADTSLGYLPFYLSDRYRRGELWTAGHAYAAGSCAWEVTPLVTASLFTVANLGDPSALLGPGLSWSVAEGATLEAGGYVGVGARPDDLDPSTLVDEAGIPLSPEALAGVVDLGSELGIVPATAFVALKAYF